MRLPKLIMQLSLQAKIIFITCVAVTSVFWTQGSDPFNLPKLLILTIGAFAALGSVLPRFLRLKTRSFHKWPLIATIFVIISLLNSFIFAPAPKLQMFFGVSGRNTGFLDYLCLAILFLVSASFRNVKDIKAIRNALLVSGAISLIICTYEVLGINIQGVEGSFQTSIIGTFGNPDFISAFLGMAGVALFALILDRKLPLILRILIFSPVAYIVYLIVYSRARQGLVVFVGGCALLFYFFLRSKTRNRILLSGYLSSLLITAAFSVAGAINVGPLAKYIFKSSVTYRGYYWDAGIEMFKSHPLTGVGLNSYGDWYRYVRTIQTVKAAGPDDTSNAAHNVFIDFAATGGLPFFLAFLGIILVTLISVYKFLRRNRAFDSTFFALLGAWLIYLIQAIVSIDQIGLAIWGWVLAGCLIAYEFLDRVGRLSDTGTLIKEGLIAPKVVTVRTKDTAMITSAFIFLLVGLSISLQVFKADIDFITAIKLGSADRFFANSNQWPTNQNKSVRISSEFLAAKLNAQALDVAITGTKRYPRSYELWVSVYINPNASIEQKRTAVENMKKLDPRNPQLIGLTVNN